MPKRVPEAARLRNMFFLDATCPLVSKVHVEAQRSFDKGLEILLIGHDGHPEVIGTMGQLPEGAISLIETIEDARRFEPKNADSLGLVTQTTLSVDDTADIVAVLHERFPNIETPPKEDICYATTNRQEAVKAVAHKVDAMLVVGAPNSSNSQRLREVAERMGCAISVLVQRASEIDWAMFEGISSLGIAAGASAPEELVDEIIEAFGGRFEISVTTEVTAEENVRFNVPRQLRETEAQSS